MKKFIFILFLLSLTITTYSQNKDVKWVYGIESSAIFRPIKNEIGKNWNYSYGLNIMKPYKQFSLGVGLLHTNYGESYYEAFTEESFINQNGGNPPEKYYFYYKTFKLNYIVLSNRLQYRLPCNCIFVHVAYNLELLGWRTEKFRQKSKSSTKNEPYKFEEATDLKRLNTSLEIGIGFKMHFNDKFKIVMRPTYNITKIPSKTINRFYSGDAHFLRIALGVQMGI